MANWENDSFAPNNNFANYPTNQSNEQMPDFSAIYNKAQSGDPVSRAVMNNIMGKIPTKKEKINIRCEVCNIDFSSQVPLNDHLAGAKHAKKLKAQVILKTLQEGGQMTPEVADETNLECKVCSIKLNSSQQLQMHLEGSKHKSKCKRSSIEMSASKNENNGEGGDQQNWGEQNEEDTVDEPASKMGKFKCETCQVPLNSQQQYDQHIMSKKHNDRVNGVKPQKNKRQFNRKQAFFKGARPAGSSTNFDFTSGLPLLSESFLPPGSVLGDNMP